MQRDEQIRDAIMRDVCELSPAAQVDDDELIVCTYEQLSKIITDHLAESSLLTSSGATEKDEKALSRSDHPSEISNGDQRGEDRDVSMQEHLATWAPYFCSKNHPLADVAWEGQFRRGTCECGRVLAWSKKGNE